MRLKIVEQRSGEGAFDAQHLFHQMQRRSSEHLTDAIACDVGTAYISREFSGHLAANRLLDAMLPPDCTPAMAMDHLGGIYTDIPCLNICPNPHALPDSIQPWIDHLESEGWRDAGFDILRAGPMPPPVDCPPDLRIIPARASYRHIEALFGSVGDPEVMMRHLDDPHYDLLLALQSGEAVGCAGVLSGGEIGVIEQVHILAGASSDVADALISRLLQNCVRATFKHVLAGQTDAAPLLRKWGFRPAGRFASWQSSSIA